MAAQLLANALVAASTILVVAVGFAIIFETTRFFHFAHGAIFTVGAYFTFALHRLLGAPLVVALALSMVGSALLACGVELGVYRGLRRRHASPIMLLLASLGLYVVLQNSVGLLFGDDTKSIRGSGVQPSWDLLGARLTTIQLAIIVVSAGLIAVVYLLARTTRAGKAIRAVANDPDLAAASGIEVEGVVVWVFAVGSALAGAAGTLVALDVDMRPTMGLTPFMLAVVAVIVGGRGSIPGIALGALLVAFAQQLAGWWLGAEWQDAMAFVVLLVFLVARPRGFLGRKQRGMAW